MNSVKKFNPSSIKKVLKETPDSQFTLFDGLLGVPAILVYDNHGLLSIKIAEDAHTYRTVTDEEWNALVNNRIIPSRVGKPNTFKGVLTTQVIKPTDKPRPEEVMEALLDDDVTVDFVCLYSSHLTDLHHFIKPTGYIHPTSGKLKKDQWSRMTTKNRKGTVLVNNQLYVYSHKKEDCEIISVVTDIHYKVQRNGEIRPTLILEEVTVNNVTYQRLPLHHIRILQDKRIGIGSAVKLKVDRSRNLPLILDKVYNRPCDTPTLTECPSCARHLVDNDQRLFCMNSGCRERNISQLQYTLCEVLQVSNISATKVRALYNKYPTIFKLFDATEEDLKLVSGFGEASAYYLHRKIQNSRTLDLTTQALISHVFIDDKGNMLSKLKLSRIFKKLDNIDTVSRGGVYRTLTFSSSIGDQTAHQFLLNFNKFLDWRETYKYYSVN
ncbi:DNA ligase [Vibrio phage vB_VcorM_GR11A]|nr:DNA ligase [Vibrio phage vB_VcorM_GR11A]